MSELNVDQIIKEINDKLILFNCKKNTISGFDREIKNIIMKDQHVVFKLNRLNSEITQQCNTITNVKKNIILHKNTNTIISSEQIHTFISKEIRRKKNKIENFINRLETQKLIHISNFDDDNLYKINNIILQHKFKLQELYFPKDGNDIRSVFCETTPIVKEKLKQEIIVLQNEIKIYNNNIKIQQLNENLISIIEKNNTLLTDLQNDIDIDTNDDPDLLNYREYLIMYSSHKFLCDYINKYIQSYMLINKYKIDIGKCYNLSVELCKRLEIYTIEVENSIIKNNEKYIKKSTDLLNETTSKYNLNEDYIISINKLSDYQEKQLQFNKDEICSEISKVKEYYIKKDEHTIKTMSLNTFITWFSPHMDECSICFESKMLFKTYTCEHYICQKCYISIDVKHTINNCPYCRCNKKTEFMCLLFNKFNKKIF